MNKLLTSIQNSWDTAINYFTMLPWWAQLLIALFGIVICLRIVVTLIQAIFGGCNNNGN